MPVRLTVKPVQLASSAAEFSIDVETSLTVSELKEQVSERVGMSKADIRLVCAGRIWQDVSAVATYEPQNGSVVHCLNNAPRGAAAAPAAVQQQQAGAATAPPAMPGMPGMPGMPVMPAPAAGGDPFQQMMAQAQSMMQNPQMVQQLMSSPMVQQMMSDPETVRAMLRMNPQLSQLMEQRPEIARLLDDPEVLQQSMRLATNPSLMREMTRNADRAIGQLDAMPGGHDALLRAHADFADPLYEALSGSTNNDGSSAVSAYTQSTEGGPNSDALPNPWGAPAPAPVAAPAQVAAPAAAGLPAAGGMDPLMAAMFGGQQPLAVAGQQQAPQANANPMAAMMQQMMSDPAQMQQITAMSRSLMGPQAGAGAGAQATSPQQPMNPFMPAAFPTAQPGPAQPPAAANPFQAMMQQMMADPQQMQQMMAMTQQMMGGGGFGAGPPGAAPLFPAAASPAVAPSLAPAATAPAAAGAPAEAELALQRVRFASQLSQLVAMGFTNDAACLRALARHGGRVDAAIETLLSSPPE